jgi:hypothetical protein
VDYTDPRKLAQESGAPEGSPLYNAIGGAAIDLASASHRIRSLSIGIRSELDVIDLKLDAATRRKPIFSSLGELQSRGPAIDAAIAHYNAQQNTLDILLGLARDMYPTDEPSA